MIINLARLSQRLSQSIHVFALQAPHRHLTVWGSHQRWHTKHRAWLELNMPRSMFWQIIFVPPYEPKTTYQRIRERWPFNELSSETRSMLVLVGRCVVGESLPVLKWLELRQIQPVWRPLLILSFRRRLSQTKFWCGCDVQEIAEELFWVAPILANYLPLLPNPCWHSQELSTVAWIKMQSV